MAMITIRLNQRNEKHGFGLAQTTAVAMIDRECMRVSRRGRDGMITAHFVDNSSSQEGCVEHSAAFVEMPTDTPSGFWDK
jgi:hypothetical protein